MNQPLIEYREYQNRVVNNVIKAWKEGHKNILIVAPTGSGKTIMAHEIVRRICLEFPDWFYAWTCLRKVLVNQARECNLELFGLRNGVYFSSFTKDENLPKKKCKILIEDEAQHSASNTSTSLHAKLEPDLHVAMTATPYRTDHVKLCFSKVINDAGIRQLIDEGYLSPFHQYVFNLDWTPSVVADIYLNDRAKWGKTVIFFSTKEQCYTCQALLLKQNVRSEVVVGGDNEKQEEQIAMFNRGEIDVLINVYVLTEGFDSPELKTVFCRPASKGPTVQMCGRALRKHKDKAYAQMVQNTRSLHPFTTIASCAEKFILEDGKWISRSANTKKMHDAHINAMRSIAKAPPATLPKFILKRKAETTAQERRRLGRMRSGTDIAIPTEPQTVSTNAPQVQQ